MQRLAPILLAAMLAMAPLGAQAADLVVWWEEGFNPEEDSAVREIVAAFEQGSGKQVDLLFHPYPELPFKIVGALETGEVPDFAVAQDLIDYIPQWAFDDRLVDLTDTVGPFSNLFDADALAWGTLLDARTGQKALYALPIGRSTNHIHIWASLLKRAGFTLADVPRQWDAFWSFWCDQVQPAVRQALGRDDIWGVGLPMSVLADGTQFEFFHFVAANQADYITRDGQLVIDDPKIRRALVEALDSYTGIYRKGCTPPGSVTWGDPDNNKAFLAQTVVMTLNETLSIPNAVKRERPEDYRENTATIEWPLDRRGEPSPIGGSIFPAVVFKGGENVGTAKEFVRFLVAEGWLMHYLNFSGERFLPTISKLLDQPFWLDPSDPHRMASVMQVASRPLAHNYDGASGDWRHGLVRQEHIWQKAINRVAAEGISPEQAVDEAIARIKQILSE
jgi:multiple sugar transport system substrate-binding protein